jgi:hypothetical protein
LRCAHADGICRSTVPALMPTANGARFAACHHKLTEPAHDRA